MKFIDIHNHFAWDVDDGMDTKEHALCALQHAHEDGIQTIIATPHLVPGVHPLSHIQTLKNRILELKELAKSCDISIYSGCELFLNSSYFEFIECENLLTLADSKYLLCEFDVRKDINHNEEAESMLYEIMVRDLVPVIAHVERYFHSSLDLNRIQEWIDAGYIIQVNRTSFLGYHGKQAKKNAFTLLNRGMIHIVASDAHRFEGARIAKLSDVYKLIADEVGTYNAKLLLFDNPNHILNHEAIVSMKAIQKQTWISRLLRR